MAVWQSPKTADGASFRQHVAAARWTGGTNRDGGQTFSVRKMGSDPDLAPAIEVAVGRLPRTVALRQVAPGRPRPQHPQDRVEDTTVVAPRTTGLAPSIGEELPDALELVVGQVEAGHPEVYPRFTDRP